MASGQYASFQSGAATSIRADAIVTNAYVGSTTVDLMSYTSVTIYAVVTMTQATTISLKFQWSHDGSNWFDETVEVAGSPSGSELAYTPYSRVETISLATAGNIWCGRSNRLGRYFRCAIKSGAETTGTIALLIHKQSLSN